MLGLMWRVMSTVTTLLGAAVAQRALSTVWRATTGSHPPDAPENPETRLVEAIGYAVVAGAALNVARVMATRQAARFYARRNGGRLPKAMVAAASRSSAKQSAKASAKALVTAS